MGMLDGLIEQLSTSEPVIEAMQKLTELRGAVIASLVRFDGRLDRVEVLQNQILNNQSVIMMKLDKILGDTGETRPAADDGLMKMLAESGEEMKVLESCKYCGPICYGGAAHNARVEDNAFYSDDISKEQSIHLAIHESEHDGFYDALNTRTREG